MAEDIKGFKKGEESFSVRGKLIEGKIIRMKAKKTAVIEVKSIKFISKYERYLLKRKRYPVHVPEGLEISVGDYVLCGETRKISKTKSFVIIKKIDKKDSSEDIEDSSKYAVFKESNENSVKEEPLEDEE